MNARPKIAVIGGGLTGLAAAHRLSELSGVHQLALDVTLFEAAPRLGGVFGTLTIDGHLVETGADSFITNKTWAVDLCRRLGLEDRIIGTTPQFRRSLILHQGRPQPTPDGLELMVPRKLRALLASPLLSLPGKLAVASEAFVPAKTDDADESLADFVRRRMGPEMLERIVQPMVGGIYTSDPEKLSMQATLPRFVQMEREYGSLLRAVWEERRRPPAGGGGGARESEDAGGPEISGARYGLFASLSGGMSELLDALKERVRSSANVALETAVEVIEPLPSGGYGLVASGRPPARFDGIIAAVPAFQAARLITPWDERLGDELNRIPYASSAIVVTGHVLADTTHPLDAFGLVVPRVENRRILAVSFLSRKFAGRSPEGTAQLRTFVGGAMQSELIQQDDDSLLAMVLEELRDLLGVGGQPLFHHVARYERGMPQYHVGHLERIAAIERLELSHPLLALAGNAYRGVGLPDCIHSGEQAAQRVLGALLQRSHPP